MPFIVEFLGAAIRGGLVSNMEPKAAAMYVVDIIDAPHKWAREYAAWAALGRPDNIAFDLSWGAYGGVLLDDGIQSIRDVIGDEPDLATGAFDNAYLTKGLFR
jgi:hypothetical protein